MLPFSCFGPAEPRRARAVSRGTAAFTLIELMVAVGLLSFIILGLLAMFNQTQRAFRGSITQTDVLETGRAVTEMLSRELEQMTPSQSSNVMNFFAEPAPYFPAQMWQGLPGTTYRGMANTQDRRTNVMQRFFFLSYLNQDWIGSGYETYPESGPEVGTLYRWSMTNTPRFGVITQSTAFLAAASAFSYRTQMSRIADGIVHMRVRAYAPNGFMITNGALYARLYARPGFVENTAVYRSTGANGDVDPEQYSCYFLSNATPAYLELELAILEPQALQRYRAINNAAAQSRYLSNHVGQVHLFRHRIPVRNYDPSAYQ